MIVQILITNSNPTPVVFRGTGFSILIPGYAVGIVAHIPQENAQTNILNVQLEHPCITISGNVATEGIPTNDIVYVPPDYLVDNNYQGAWDAASGADPHGSPEPGWYWRVVVSGSHPLDGLTRWDPGDHVKWNGSRWMKIATCPEMGVHENLGLLQGGNQGEYYHLTAEEHAILTAQGQVLSSTSNVVFQGLTVEDFTLDGGVLEDDAVEEDNGHVIKFERGQADKVDDHVPQAGEPVFDLERKELRIGDGSKVGGHIIGRVTALDPQIINTGTTVVDEILDTEARGAAWFYTIDHDNSADMRTGQIQACWDKTADGKVAPMPEEAGPDIGTTLGVVYFLIHKTGHAVQLKCMSASDDWIVDIIRMPIG